jgi:hypothetical protein
MKTLKNINLIFFQIQHIFKIHLNIISNAKINDVSITHERDEWNRIND